MVAVCGLVNSARRWSRSGSCFSRGPNNDLAAWEGVRTCAEALDDAVALAHASERLGELWLQRFAWSRVPREGGLLWIERAGDADRGERALEAGSSETRVAACSSTSCSVGSVRAKTTIILLQLISKRLEVADQSLRSPRCSGSSRACCARKATSKGRWRRSKNGHDARARSRGCAGALKRDLHSVRETSPTPSTGSLVSRRIPRRPAAASGIRHGSGRRVREQACGSRQGLPDLAQLHGAGSRRLPLRERLGASRQPRNEAWVAATSTLETLMNERGTREGRIEAARLAMAIYRDKSPGPFRRAQRLRSFSTRRRATWRRWNLVLKHPELGSASWRRNVLDRARRRLVDAIGEASIDAASVELLGAHRARDQRRAIAGRPRWVG